MGRSICTTQERSERTNVGYSWLGLLHGEHRAVPSPSILWPAELLHHTSSRGGGVLRTAALGNYLESHWKTKMFISNQPKILGHSPKEVTSPTLLYRHRWVKEIIQAFRSRVRELEFWGLLTVSIGLLPVYFLCFFPAPFHPGNTAEAAVQSKHWEFSLPASQGFLHCSRLQSLGE